jgi:hypothetical protein
MVTPVCEVEDSRDGVLLLTFGEEFERIEVDIQWSKN